MTRTIREGSIFFIPFCHSYAPQPYGSRVGVHRVGGRHTTGGGLLLFMVRLAWPLRKDDTFRTLRLFFVEQVDDTCRTLPLFSSSLRSCCVLFSWLGT